MTTVWRDADNIERTLNGPTEEEFGELEAILPMESNDVCPFPVREAVVRAMRNVAINIDWRSRGWSSNDLEKALDLLSFLDTDQPAKLRKPAALARALLAERMRKTVAVLVDETSNFRGADAVNDKREKPALDMFCRGLNGLLGGYALPSPNDFKKKGEAIQVIDNAALNFAMTALRISCEHLLQNMDAATHPLIHKLRATNSRAMRDKIIAVRNDLFAVYSQGDTGKGKRLRHAMFAQRGTRI